MNIKKILSTALVVVLVFASVVTMIPFSAFAAYSESSVASAAKVPEGTEKEANLDSEALDKYLADYLEYNFTSASAMLNDEIFKGYLYYVNSPGNAYSLFVNKYTGFVYYVNNITGQILTSNPINPNTLSSSTNTVMSQIVLQYSEIANQSKNAELNSYTDAALRNQIQVTPISGGLRVSYTIGDPSARFLLPGMATAEDFESTIFVPMIEGYEEMLIEYCGHEFYEEELRFFNSEFYESYSYGVINFTALSEYLEDTKNDVYSELYTTSSEEYIRLNEYNTDIFEYVVGAYAQKIPAKHIGSNSSYDIDTLAKMNSDYPVTKDGTAIYVYSGTGIPETKRNYANTIKTRCPEYTFSMMFAQEAKCGYKDTSLQKPVFRCALEYTFNSDGSLSVCLPANSITFDDTAYILKSIVPLQYFGAGNVNSDGYVFYPDGSGTVVDFDDVAVASNAEIKANVFGNDYAYVSKIDDIEGNLHRAQVTMPVFGIVNEVNAPEAVKLLYGKETVTNGYFAILEEGATLASTIQVEKKPGNSAIGAYATYSPYPYDEFDMSGSIATGSKNTYMLASKVRYTGSYVTRYVMLSDEALGQKMYGENAYYAASYSGMAAYYRDYLKDNGTISQLEITNENLPLYIEALGAMDITSKFLSFPVTESIPLTSFANVSQIFEELSNCEAFAKEQVAKFEEMAEKEADPIQKEYLLKQAARYRELDGQIVNIKNINFKLTGFANGGMKATYPAQLEWADACGGDSGLKNLLKATKQTDAGEHFAIYPEFDFQYVNYTSFFDGIDTDESTSLLIDNRYASKQVYNSIMQGYETFFTMLISPSSLNYYYNKFKSDYSEFNVGSISLSTLGSDLNSNFAEENTINREEAMGMVQNLFAKVVADGNDVMIDTGNIYAVKYASHILNMPIDSSHLRIASYTVPFTGMVLHSYVNYTGEPINYSGSPAYDRLRAIESGAALYYIVCFQNTAYMKDDDVLSDYYGVDYHNWFADIAENYKILNDLIGDLQDYEITDHKVLIAERVIAESEMALKYHSLYNELVAILDSMILDTIDSALESLKGDASNHDKRIKLEINVEDILASFALIVDKDVAEFDKVIVTGEKPLKAMVTELVKSYTDDYAGAEDDANNFKVEFKFAISDMALKIIDNQIAELVKATNINKDTQEIKLVADRAAIMARLSTILDVEGDALEALVGAKLNAIFAKYSASDDSKADVEVKYSTFNYITDIYITESNAEDEDYIYTNFTIDNGNVTMVTYTKGDSAVRFVLNYNNYPVTVKLADQEQSIRIGAYGYAAIRD